MKHMTANVASILNQVRSLTPEQQIEVAEALDRMTWAQRWRRVCERIEGRASAESVPSDEEIDEEVRTVRREKPLSERSSTPR